jgi:predicted TIM-barrel enzyme
VVERARQSLRALQEGEIDAVMFSNESSLPYLTKVEPITYVSMARIIGEIRKEIKVPFGVDVLWDPTARRSGSCSTSCPKLPPMWAPAALPDTPVFASTGVRLANVEEQLAVADGAVVGTTFKRDGYI